MFQLAVSCPLLSGDNGPEILSYQIRLLGHISPDVRHINYRLGGKNLMNNFSTSFLFQISSSVDQKSQIEVAISSLSASVLRLPTATSLNVTYEADGSVSAGNNLSGFTDVSEGVAVSVAGTNSSGGGVISTTDVTVYIYTVIVGFRDKAVVAFADTTSGDINVEVNNHDYTMSFQVTGGSGAEKATELVTQMEQRGDGNYLPTSDNTSYGVPNNNVILDKYI